MPFASSCFSFLTLTPPAKAPAKATFIPCDFVSAVTLNDSEALITAPSDTFALTLLLSWLTMTVAPTATPEDDFGFGAPSFTFTASVC